MKKIAIYDTTLRDGTQADEINLSSADKVRIALKLDDLGVDYIEGGWPGSNKTDRAFFAEIKNHKLSHAKITAFGSTHSAKNSAENDKNLATIIEAAPDAVTLFGKTWDLHVREALRVPLERNLELIHDSLAFMRPKFAELFYDAEHFFDGYKTNRDYALATLAKAHEGGADVLVLCDTNGGTLPHEIGPIMDDLKSALPKARFGIHTHNDTDSAVANSIEAVRHGSEQIQGTINGYGERCGNANLCSIIPNLELKFDGAYRCLPEGKIEQLTRVANFISETCNLRPFLRQPYVGRSAFAHKGGVHVSAVMRNARTYEHVVPEEVGNHQRILLSDLSGRSNILFMAKKFGYDLDKNDSAVLDLLTEIKERESIGYEYSTAEASFELMFFRAMGWSKQYFKLLNFSVMDALRENGEAFIEATVMAKVGGKIEHTAASGKGQVNSLDQALRKALYPFYPCLKEMRLDDFKVRVLSGTTRDTGGTASNVRVLIESADKNSRWTTVGVSYDVIHASWEALVDSVNYKLFKDDPKKWPSKKKSNNTPDFNEPRREMTMAERGSALRGWLLALMGAAVLFLAGLVLSYILWNRIESASVVPCEGHVAREVASARENLTHAAALLGPQAPELVIGLSHIFQFPFEHAAFIAPYTSALEIRDQLDTLWECSEDWASHVTDNDSYISLLAVTAAGVIPVRLQRTQFDLAEPTEGRFGPETLLILRKRPGSDQILIRVQPPSEAETTAAPRAGELPTEDK